MVAPAIFTSNGSSNALLRHRSAKAAVKEHKNCTCRTRGLPAPGILAKDMCPLVMTSAGEFRTPPRPPRHPVAHSPSFTLHETPEKHFFSGLELSAIHVAPSPVVALKSFRTQHQNVPSPRRATCASLHTPIRTSSSEKPNLISSMAERKVSTHSSST